jgi:hypothetical protein
MKKTFSPLGLIHFCDLYLNVQAYVTCLLSLKILNMYIYIYITVISEYERICPKVSDGDRESLRKCSESLWESRSALMNERKSKMEDSSSPLSWASGGMRERMILRYMWGRKRDSEYILVSREIHPPISLTKAPELVDHQTVVWER